MAGVPNIYAMRPPVANGFAAKAPAVGLYDMQPPRVAGPVHSARQGAGIEALAGTWPAKLAQALLAGVTLPGDVYAGRVNPNSDEAVGRAADLAGLVTLGAGAIPQSANTLNMGIKAYHGSPHDFDKFDMSKIGTGEGAQAYGHGLYFAENEAVAKGYREALTKGNDSVVNSYLSKYNDNIDAAIRDVEANVKAYSMLPEEHSLRREMLPDNERDLSILRAHKEGKPSGRSYEVSINAHPDEFLNWDAPLSEQPKATQDAVRKLWADYRLPGDPMKLNGEGIAGSLHATNYQVGMKRGASQEAGAMDLRAAGIKGIKYKDAGSRSAEGGTHNYVVFDDKIIDILKKYGIAGLTAGGLAGASIGQPNQAQAGER